MKRSRQAGVAWSRPEGTRCYVSLRADLGQRFPGLLATILAADEDQVPPVPVRAADAGQSWSRSAADAGQRQPGTAGDAGQARRGTAAERQPSGACYQ